MNRITLLLRAGILQNTKRLRTFSRPQQSEILPIDRELFEKVSLLALIRFKDAFEKVALKNSSKDIVVELAGISKLEISDKMGSMILEANSQLSTLFYNSPLTGTYKYYYDEQQKIFYSNKDGHLLDENLSRQAQRYFGDVLEL